jgi:hypothetical protein
MNVAAVSKIDAKWWDARRGYRNPEVSARDPLRDNAVLVTVKRPKQRIESVVDLAVGDGECVLKIIARTPKRVRFNEPLAGQSITATDARRLVPRPDGYRRL